MQTEELIAFLETQNDRVFGRVVDWLLDRCCDLPLPVLTYMANRSAWSISRGLNKNRGVCGGRTRTITTFPYLIYWIVRKDNPQVPWYVGVTRQLSERWQQHQNKGGALHKRKDKDEYTVKVVETIVCEEQESFRHEAKAIGMASRVNPELWNRQHSEQV